MFVFLVLVGTATWVGYNVFPFYYYYYELLNQFDAAARVASTETDASIREKLIYQIKHLGIPVAPEELVIQREGDQIRIVLDYEEVWYIEWQDKEYIIYKFPFHAEAQRMIW